VTSAAEIVRFLASNGYRIGLSEDGVSLHVIPKLKTETLRQRVLARKPEIVSFLRELGAPAATLHIFVAAEDADEIAVRELGVCIACGIPWSLHGEPPARTWERTSNPDAVALIEATAIVQAAADRSTEDAR